MLEMVKRPPTRTSQTQRQLSTRAGSEVLVSLGVRPTPLRHVLHHASLDRVDSSIRTWNMRRHQRIVIMLVFLCLMMIMTSLTTSTWYLGNLSKVPIAKGRNQSLRTVLHYMVSHGNPTPKNSAMQISGKDKKCMKRRKRKKKAKIKSQKRNTKEPSKEKKRVPRTNRPGN